MSIEVRLDKWLWAVRIYKTRSIAIEAIKMGRVLINGLPVKPSRFVNVGDELYIKKPPIIYTFKVLGLIDKRIGAKLVSDYVVDLTPPEELAKLEHAKFNTTGLRERGSGRPTKKERRDLESFFDLD